MTDESSSRREFFRVPLSLVQGWFWPSASPTWAADPTPKMRPSLSRRKTFHRLKT